MRLILFIPLAGIVSPLVCSQSGSDKEFSFSAHSDLVLLDVSVKQAKGGYLTGLKKDNFRVYEDGKEQTISQFGSEDTPITAGLVLDDSRSMRSKRQEAVTAALIFVDASNPRDEMFVIHFNDRVRRGLPPGRLFSDDPELLRRALWNNPAEGMTALYDGILEGLHQLESGTAEKKSLVIISDGGDNASSQSFKDVVDAVRSTRAILFTIGVFDTNDDDRNPRVLSSLARMSGGVAYFPKEVSELKDICFGIAKDLRNRYSIGYIPVRTSDKNSLRTIKVSVVGAGDQKLAIHARTGYLLPAHPEAIR